MGYRPKTEFSTEEFQMAEKHLEKCSTSLVIRESKRLNTSDSLHWKDVEQGEHSSTAGGSANWYSHYENKYGSF